MRRPIQDAAVMPNTLTPTLEAEQVNNRPTQHIFFSLGVFSYEDRSTYP